MYQIKRFVYVTLQFRVCQVLICVHISRTLDLVIMFLSYKYSFYAKNKTHEKYGRPVCVYGMMGRISG